MNPSRKKPPKIETASALINSAAKLLPDYLQEVVRTVEVNWEEPDSDQYDHAYQGYLEEQQTPFLKLELIRAQKVARAKHIAERMIEIAPEYFEKALSRSAFETGYFIEKGKTDDQ